MMHFNTIFARHTRLIAIAVYVAEAGLALAAPENTPEINWSDALAGWQRLETNTNSLSCDLSETFISPAKAQSTSELAKWSLNYKRDWYRIQKTALQDGKVHHEKAWVRNSAYSFVVAKSSKASPWVLYDVTFELEKPTEADIGDKNFGMKVRMPWCVFDVPLRTLVDEPSFTIKSSSKSIRGSDQLVEFQFEVSNPDSPSSNLRRLRNGRVVLVPAMNWAICDYDAALSSLDGQNSITTHAVAHIDYVNENSGTARVRDVDYKLVPSNGPVLGQWKTHFDHNTACTDDEQKFQLTSYDLPEPQRPQRFWEKRWFIMNVVAIVCLGIAVALRRK